MYKNFLLVSTTINKMNNHHLLPITQTYCTLNLSIVTSPFCYRGSTQNVLLLNAQNFFYLCLQVLPKKNNHHILPIITYIQGEYNSQSIVYISHCLCCDLVFTTTSRFGQGHFRYAIK